RRVRLPSRRCRPPEQRVPDRVARRRAGDRICHRACLRHFFGSRQMTPGQVVAIFSVALVALVVGFLVFETYNAGVALRLRIDKAWANIDVALKQRHDMLPSLVAAVRDLMQFEQDVLVDVTRARAAYAPTETIPAQAAVSDATTAAVRSLFAVVEQYPNIKSQGNV